MRNILMSVLLSLVAVIVCAQDKGLYDRFYNETLGMDLKEIIKSGNSYAATGPDTAMVFYSIAFNRYANDTTYETRKIFANQYLVAGNIYRQQGNYMEAMMYFINGLKICEAAGIDELLPKYYNNIGNLYCIFQDYESGLNYMKTGYRLCMEQPDEAVRYAILINLCASSCYIGDTKAARRYYAMADSLDFPAKEVKDYFSALNYGLILAGEKQYGQAAKYYAEAVKHAGGYKAEPHYLCSAYEEMYKLFDKANMRDSALYYMDLCKETAEKYNLTDILAQTYKSYSSFYEGRDLARSLEYKSKYLQLSDSLFNVREISRVKSMHFLYEADKVRKQISEYDSNRKKDRHTIEMQQKIMIVILSGVVIISILLLVVYRQKKKIQQSYIDLFNINKGITASEKLNRERRHRYEQEVNELKKEIEDLKAENARSHGCQEEEVRYQASSLNNDSRQKILQAVADVMENTQEFCAEDFSLEKLASLIGSNTKYVSQVINEHYGKNFSNFVNEYRIQEARLRLADTEHYGNYTIQAVAESVGYKSHSTFVKIFRKITGITPSMYQKMAREQSEDL